MNSHAGLIRQYNRRFVGRIMQPHHSALYYSLRWGDDRPPHPGLDAMPDGWIRRDDITTIWWR